MCGRAQETFHENSMPGLVRGSKETGQEKPPEEVPCLSAAELLSWERKHSQANGKYTEALRVRASVSRQTSVKVHFNTAIANIF